MAWKLHEDVKEELSEYQYSYKIKNKIETKKNNENYSPRDYYYENIDEWESLTW